MLLLFLPGVSGNPRVFGQEDVGGKRRYGKAGGTKMPLLKGATQQLVTGWRQTTIHENKMGVVKYILVLKAQNESVDKSVTT